MGGVILRRCDNGISLTQERGTRCGRRCNFSQTNIGGRVSSNGKLLGVVEMSVVTYQSLQT